VELDDELCLCFHVTKRKVINFIKVTKPKRVGQLAECYGAGTGCGWCRSYLCRLFQQAEPPAQATEQPGDEPSAAEYAHRRSAYVRAGGGTPPPGATPIEPEAGQAGPG
jgi:bacterioferritin-associated ferredoxin